MENKAYKNITAIEFLKEANRMCKSIEGCSNCILCDTCSYTCKLSVCDDSFIKNIEKIVQGVGNWSNENPVKTRLSEFLKMFPNLSLSPYESYPTICVRHVDKSIICDANCEKCKEEFWNQEVE